MKYSTIKFSTFHVHGEVWKTMHRILGQGAARWTPSLLRMDELSGYCLVE